MDGSNPFCLLEEHLWLGVGDIIEKIIDCRYIGIFSSSRQINDFEKKYILGLSKNYRFSIRLSIIGFCHNFLFVDLNW